jgi:hypothetical protein
LSASCRILACVSVIVHGVPGRPYLGGRGFAAVHRARAGSVRECTVAAALADWLTVEPGEFHLFHDLHGIPGYAPNIDHVILTGSGVLVLDAKWLRDGQLLVNRASGLGWLRRPGGGHAVSWLEPAYRGSAAAALVAQPGARCFVIPDHTVITTSVDRAGCLTGDHGGLRAAVLTLRDVCRMAHDLWPVLFPRLPVSPTAERVAALGRYVRA